MSVVGGMQLLYVYVPWGDVGIMSLGRDVGVAVTVLFTVVTINAINFIDGLNGLVAGVSAINAMAFFAYSYHLAEIGNSDVALADVDQRGPRRGVRRVPGAQLRVGPDLHG